MTIVKEDMQTLLSKGKIKKYMRGFNEIYLNRVPLGDREKVCKSLNNEFAYFFTNNNDLISKFIDFREIKDPLYFRFIASGSRLFVQITKKDQFGNIVLEIGGVRNYKNIAVSTFIFEYCNPEGLILLEKALFNYA